MCQSPRHLLASGDVVKGNELRLSEGLFCRHLGQLHNQEHRKFGGVPKTYSFRKGHLRGLGHVVIRSLKGIYGDWRKAKGIGRNTNSCRITRLKLDPLQAPIGA